MPVWYFRFHGIWPVGACGYVTATDKIEAIALAREAVRNAGCDVSTIDELHPISRLEPHAHIILNGDY